MDNRCRGVGGTTLRSTKAPKTWAMPLNPCPPRPSVMNVGWATMRSSAGHLRRRCCEGRKYSGSSLAESQKTPIERVEGRPKRVFVKASDAAQLVEDQPPIDVDAADLAGCAGLLKLADNGVDLSGPRRARLRKNQWPSPAGTVGPMQARFRARPPGWSLPGHSMPVDWITSSLGPARTAGACPQVGPEPQPTVFANHTIDRPGAGDGVHQPAVP